MIRIRLDENLSHKIAQAIRALRIPSDVKIESALEEKESGLSDVSWIELFTRRGGRCVLSGDGMMHYREPERAALEAGGLVAIFVPVPRFWRPLRKWGQAALILRWYPVIEIMARTAEPGSHWRIPPSFSPDITKLRPMAKVIRGGKQSPAPRGRKATPSPKGGALGLQPPPKAQK